MLKNSSTTIVDKMMIEMGITGELLFSDSYSEANIYKLDSLNHKIGPDSSFIGKNDSYYYFHSNDISKETVLIGLGGEAKKDAPEEAGFKIPEEPIINSIADINQKLENTQEVENSKEEKPDETNSGTELTSLPEESNVDDNEKTEVNDIDETEFDNDNLKLDISQNILSGFKPLLDQKDDNDSTEESSTNEEDNDSKDTDNKVEEEKEANVETENDEVLDSVIEVMKKND